MKRVLAATAALALSLTVAACGSDESEAGAPAEQTTITVYAAASLTDVFTDLGKKFEAEHEGVTVTFSFGGSSDLVEQIQQGAPADVFASADEKNMAKLTDAGLEGEGPEDFASNTLEIATPPDNPAGVDSFADLTSAGLKLVICAAEVPCGAAAQKVAQAAGVTLKPVSEEQSVKDVLAKVASGEADAGLVYVTDVLAAGDAVTGVTFPETDAAVNVYPIATLKDSKHAALAEDFLQFVLGSTGQQALASAGFAKP